MMELIARAIYLGCGCWLSVTLGLCIMMELAKRQPYHGGE
jgi:hypothetical protein